MNTTDNTNKKSNFFLRLIQKDSDVANPQTESPPQRNPQDKTIPLGRFTLSVESPDSGRVSSPVVVPEAGLVEGLVTKFKELINIEVKNDPNKPNKDNRDRRRNEACEGLRDGGWNAVG